MPTSVYENDVCSVVESFVTLPCLSLQYWFLVLDEWGADFAPTMREALKCWNMTVQHWLGRYSHNNP